MPYICLKRLKVGDGYREYGDLIPEVDEWDWKIKHTYERAGYIRSVPPEEVPAQSSAAVAVAEKPASPSVPSAHHHPARTARKGAVHDQAR